MGRPKVKIDYSLVEKLSTIQCTQEEIAEIVGVNVRTLQRDDEFCRIYKKSMEYGKSSLRRMQWKAAETGNTTMLVWLGKQYLGQSEKQDLSIDTVQKEAVDAISKLTKKFEKDET